MPAAAMSPGVSRRRGPRGAVHSRAAPLQRQLHDSVRRRRLRARSNEGREQRPPRRRRVEPPQHRLHRARAPRPRQEILF